MKIKKTGRMSPEELQAYLHHKKSGHVHASGKDKMRKRKPKHNREARQLYS